VTALCHSLSCDIRAKLTPCTATEEAEAFYEKMEKQIRVKNPGFEGAITPEQCVRDQLDLIHRVTIEQTGGFVNRDGSDGETVWL